MTAVPGAEYECPTHGRFRAGDCQEGDEDEAKCMSLTSPPTDLTDCGEWAPRVGVACTCAPIRVGGRDTGCLSLREDCLRHGMGTRYYEEQRAKWRRRGEDIARRRREAGLE